MRAFQKQIDDEVIYNLWLSYLNCFCMKNKIDLVIPVSLYGSFATP